ncbi:MAG: phosphotransferase [Acidimicrobiia bacterium]
MDWGSVSGEAERRPAEEIDLRDRPAAGSNSSTESGRRFRARLIEHLQAGGYPALESRGTAGAYDPSNPAHLEEAGRALARYHVAVGGFPYRFRAGGRPPLPSLERSGPHALASFTAEAGALLGPRPRTRLTRATSFLWSQYIRVPETLAGLLALLPQLVVHGSYDPAALIYEGDRITGVTGFDRAAYDLRALDLGLALEAFTGQGDGAGAELDLERVGALMVAYRAVEPLGDQEVAVLPLICRARCLTAVLAATTGFLRLSADTRSDEDARRLVDTVEGQADRVRWLEAGDRELVSALGGPSWPRPGRRALG